MALDAAQSVPDWLGFDDADRFGIDVQQIVGGTVRAREFANGQPIARTEVHFGIALHTPTGLLQLGVNEFAGGFLGFHRRESPEFPKS